MGGSWAICCTSAATTAVHVVICVQAASLPCTLPDSVLLPCPTKATSSAPPVSARPPPGATRPPPPLRLPITRTCLPLPWRASPSAWEFVPSPDGLNENLLVLLHGLGDGPSGFARLARQMRLPQVRCDWSLEQT